MGQRLPSTDLYAVLNVAPRASHEQIKAAYRQMVRRHHPDANPTRREEAEATIKTIIEAYGTLSDPQRRARYDQDSRLQALSDAQTTRQQDGHDEPASLVGRVRRALGIESHELAARLGLADAVLLDMEARDSVPTTPVQLRTFANLCRRAAAQLEGSGRGEDANELRLAFNRKMAHRTLYRSR